MVSGQCTQGVKRKVSVLSPRLRVSPSATTWKRASSTCRWSISIARAFSLQTTVSSGKRSSSSGVHPEWSCSTWWMIR